MPLTVDHPFPQLHAHPASGLNFNWADYTPHMTSEAEMHLGPDGVGVGMAILIFWDDLLIALQRILGQCYRAPNPKLAGSPMRLYRNLPWQHPYFPTMWAKAITSVRGVRLEGSQGSDQKGNPVFNFGPPLIFGVKPPGQGIIYNNGPWTSWHLALLTIQFWTPPYAVRSDDSITDISGNPREWLRWTDKDWKIQTEVLSREGRQYAWSQNQNFPGQSSGPPGAVGQPVSHAKLSRRWYEIPEAAIFGLAEESTTNADGIVIGPPNGIPKNFLYTQKAVMNPVTGYLNPSGAPFPTCVNITPNMVAPGTTPGRACAMTTGSSSITLTGVLYPVNSLIGWYIDAPGIPFGSVIQTQVNGALNTVVTVNNNAIATQAAAPYILEDPAQRFFGCPSGTLRFECAELIPRPLQLPAGLMGIPGFGIGSLAISQQQYDVVFHFDYFDPQRSPTGSPWRGHNLVPWAGNGLWYMIQAQVVANIVGVNLPIPGAVATTMLQYADFTDLFKVL